MKRFLLRLLGGLLALGLLAGVLWPVIAGQYRLWQGDKALAAYRDALAAMDGAALDEARARARTQDAAALADPFGGDSGASDAAILEVADNGVVAVLEIPKLGKTLPVTADLRQEEHAAALVSGGALPVDGADALCALAAPRGGWVPGPFADLDRLMEGDCFSVEALGEKLTYEVTRVETLSPGEWLDIDPADGADMCALVTTAPRGSNAQRLAVWGARADRRTVSPRDDTQAVPGWAARLAFAAPCLVVGLALLWLFEGLRRAARRHRAKRMKL